MAYVGMVDLVKRWIYSRRGLEKLMKRDDFPAPQIIINAGRTKVWYLADITAYESIHPELTSEEKKHRKIVGYAIANLKKKARQA